MKTFAIVKSGLAYNYIPDNWIVPTDDGANIVYWPKKNQTVLINDPKSVPVLSGEDKWLMLTNYDVIQRGIKKLTTACELQDRLIDGHDSDLSSFSNPSASECEHSDSPQDLIRQSQVNAKLSSGDSVILTRKARSILQAPKTCSIPTYNLPDNVLYSMTPATKAAKKLIEKTQPNANNAPSTESESEDSNDELNEYLNVRPFFL